MQAVRQDLAVAMHSHDALSHLLTDDTGNHLLGSGSARRPARELAPRACIHGEMRGWCKKFTQLLPRPFDSNKRRLPQNRPLQQFQILSTGDFMTAKHREMRRGPLRVVQQVAALVQTPLQMRQRHF